MIKWHSLHAKWIQNLISIVCNTLCELKKKYSEFQRDQNMSSQLNCIFILFVWIACTSFHFKILAETKMRMNLCEHISTKNNGTGHTPIYEKTWWTQKLSTFKILSKTFMVISEKAKLHG